ncbi:hypothetical protein ABEW05_001457 [Botrytis cinerea]
MPKRRFSNDSSDTLALEGEARSSRLRISFILNRAERVAVKLPEDGMVLRLEGEDGPITFSEDTIEDIFRDAKPKLIWVTAAPRISNRGADFVYVRWITPGRALDHLSMSDIETDREPLSRCIKVNEIIATAKNSIFGAAGNEVTPVPGFSIGLWFNRASSDTSIWALGTDTLEMLGLTGSLENPLNIFLVLINKDKLSDPSCSHLNPNSSYGFRCSLQSMATFETCLKVLISVATIRPYLIPHLLERIMLVTNIGEARNCLESTLKTSAVHEERTTILANCFREIALRMVSSAFVGHKIESVLKGSRQIFAWMFSDILEEDMSCTPSIKDSDVSDHFKW